MRYAFAGDRQISCNILTFLIEKGYKPSFLFVTDGQSSSHAEELIKTSQLEDEYIFRSKEDIQNDKKMQLLKSANLHYIFGIHYPYIISDDLLNTPSIGFLNLHPAFLPYNKGWNTPSWAIIDKTPYGATLHFMSEQLDQGDIIHQKAIIIDSDDTANSIYHKVLKLEEVVFKEAFNDLVSLNPPRKKQIEKGTNYRKSDLKKVQKIRMDDKVKVADFIDKLRALTTNNPKELAYYIENGKKIGVRIEFVELD